MKRRNFLGMLGIAPLVAAGAKFVPQKFWEGTTVPRMMPLPQDVWNEIAKSEARAKKISGYYDFATFSEVAAITAIDPVVERCARELSHAYARRISRLARTSFA